MEILKSDKTISQFIRYCIIGALTFVVDISVLSGSTYFFHLATKVGVTISFISATSVHFLLNKLINFRSDKRRTVHQLRTYVVTVILSYCTTILLMTVFVDLFSMNLSISKGVTVLLNAMWGFPAQKYLTFSRGIRSAISKWRH